MIKIIGNRPTMPRRIPVIAWPFPVSPDFLICRREITPVVMAMSGASRAKAYKKYKVKTNARYSMGMLSRLSRIMAIINVDIRVAAATIPALKLTLDSLFLLKGMIVSAIILNLQACQLARRQGVWVEEPSIMHLPWSV
jgi:hypothetical protein